MGDGTRGDYLHFNSNIRSSNMELAGTNEEPIYLEIQESGHTESNNKQINRSTSHCNFRRAGILAAVIVAVLIAAGVLTGVMLVFVQGGCCSLQEVCFK